MFSSEIVGSDPFLDMGQGAQVLYFHLAMRADDDGFVNPKSIMRMLGIADDELKVLIAKRFLLPFESGVVVVKHWLIHNLIRADLYKETQYKKEKSMLGLNENGAYTELREGVTELKKIEAPKWLKARRKQERTDNVPQTALRLGKERLGKDNNIVDLPDWLDKETWEMWVNYRKEKKKPLTGTSIKLQLKLLEEHKSDHKSILLKSIQNSWTGLFPPSGESKKQGNNALVTKHSQELIDHAKKNTIKLKS